jgi:hypothetical protein
MHVSNTTFDFLGENTMLRTIIIGACVQVQGTFVRALNDGRIVVSVGDRDFAGQPISAAA